MIFRVNTDFLLWHISYMLAGMWSAKREPKDLTKAMRWFQKALEENIKLKGEDHECTLHVRSHILYFRLLWNIPYIP